jgi:Lon-like ATP-dependent protease
LQKHIEKICRKVAAKHVELQESKGTSADDTTAADASESVNTSDVAAEAQAKTPSISEEDAAVLRVTEASLNDYVGKPLFLSDRLYEEGLPVGTVTGLAWTAMGGVVLYAEAIALPRVAEGSKAAPTLSVTGQLGGVMKESSQIALLLARREAAARLPEDRATFFVEHDFYLHCPEGATPKDGPSAGVTMTTALMSLGLDRAVRPDLAMTGEVSLNGKVLPVGGIKEKTIAARRAGCKVLVFPKANQRDFDELPEYLREGLEVHFASEYAEVFAVAFPM